MPALRAGGVMISKHAKRSGGAAVAGGRHRHGAAAQALAAGLRCWTPRRKPPRSDAEKPIWRAGAGLEPAQCRCRHPDAGAGLESAPAASRRQLRHIVVVEGQGEWRGRRVGQAGAVAVLGCPDRRRHDGGPSAPDIDQRGPAAAKIFTTASRRNPPAPPGRRSPLPASARSGTRPRSKPGSIPRRSGANSAPA